MMNTKSIRFRIFIWYSLTLFFATAIVFLSFYLVTQKILFSKVDQELFSHANQLAEITASQGINLNDVGLNQHLNTQYSDIPGMVVVLLDQNGSVVGSSISSDNLKVSFQYLFQQASNSTEPVYLNQDISNVYMRFIAVPIKNGNDFLGIVLVAHPIDAIQKSLNSLLVTLGIIFMLLIIPCVLSGQFLSSKIMHPISKISDKMQKISSDNLDERVDSLNTGDEIEKLGQTFNDLLNHLQESFGRERQFIGDVAHELKTPIATLRGEIELALSRNRTNDEYKKAFGETLIDVNRLTTTVNNILDLAWIGADNIKVGESQFDLSAVMMELKEIAIKLAFPKHITVIGEIEDGLFAAGNVDKVSRAILNIIDNAIKYTQEKGSVFVTLSKNKYQANIEIKDNGIGIEEKDLPHIFERFYRGSIAVKTLGSGLGLAIAQGIIKAHEGEIKVTSTVGQGTTVVITVPLFQDNPE